MDSNDFVSTEEIIAEASEYVNDSDFTHGVGKSFYELIVHRSIEKLALSTFFQKVTKDIFNWNECGTGTVPVPTNCFNVRELYLFNSSCDSKRNCKDVVIQVNSATKHANKTLITEEVMEYNPYIYSFELSGGIPVWIVNHPLDYTSPTVAQDAAAALNAATAGTGYVFSCSYDSMLGLAVKLGCTDDEPGALRVRVDSHPGVHIEWPFFWTVDDSITCYDNRTILDCSEGGEMSVSGCGCGCSDKKEDSCWTAFVEAHWKRTFNKFGSTGIQTSKITSFNLDPVYQRRVSVPSNLYYFGIQNGIIAMSDNSSCFKNMRVVANGFGTDNCELPIIPRALREVCVNMCVERATYKMKFVFPEYRTHWQDSQRDLYGDGSLHNPGSWLAAKIYVFSLNTKQRNDLFEYFGNIDIK